MSDEVRRAFSPENTWQRVIANERKFTSDFTRAMARVFKAQADLVIKRLRDAIPEAPRSRVSADDVFFNEEWDQLFEAEVKPLREKIYIKNGQAAFGLLEAPGTFSFLDEQIRFLDQIHADMVTNVNRETKNRITRALIKGTENGEGIDGIAKRISSSVISRKRARTIARTEVGGAAQLGQVESFAQSTVVEGKQWNASFSDTRDTHAEADRQIVLMDELFNVGFETAVAPLDPTLSAGERVNCQCFLTPVFSDDGKGA